eukprot:COSAG01_NODE_2908_length_6880_cov_42.122401_3_plen_297_part_00
MGVDVNASIVQWGLDMDEMKRARGEEPRLNRVPCPEAATRSVIEQGERAVGQDLGWLALLVVQLLCWLRADSVAGLQRGDVCVRGDGGYLSVAIRYMKNRPEFRSAPGLIEMPGGRGRQHWRSRALRVHVLERASRLYRGWETLLAHTVTHPNASNGSAAAGILTAKLRYYCLRQGEVRLAAPRRCLLLGSCCIRTYLLILPLCRPWLIIMTIMIRFMAGHHDSLHGWPERLLDFIDCLTDAQVKLTVDGRIERPRHLGTTVCMWPLAALIRPTAEHGGGVLVLVICVGRRGGVYD